MKLVFDLEEVSDALGQTPESFKTLRPKLESIGFPKPVRGLDERWSIMDVMNWVKNEGASSGGGFAETAPDIGRGTIVNIKPSKMFVQ